MTRQSYGAGSMSEREPGVWRLRVMVDGKQVQRTFRGTEAAARKELRKLDVQPAALPKGVHTFGDLLDEWMTFQESRGRAPKTLDENRREIEARIRPRLGNIPVTDLTAHDLDKAYSAWSAEGLAASSVHRHAAVISAGLTQGVKWGWLDASPRASAPTAASSRKLVTPTTKEVARLIGTAQSDDPVMAAAIALAFVTGARRGELCALLWSDIDLDMGMVRIEKSLSQVGNDLAIKSTKTDRGRTVSLDGRAVALLRHHQEWQRSFSDEAESPLAKDPYVLSDNANGARPIEPSKVTDRFMALRKAARVRQGVRFHDLRHAHVTQLLSAGVDATTVAIRVGHASTRMTLDRYAHALPAGDVAAAKLIGALLP